MTEEKTLRIDLVTPEGSLLSDEAEFVAVPAAGGEVGVLPSHTPLLSRLGIGDLRITSAGDAEDWIFAVRGGFLQVVGDHVTLLAAEALPPGEIDLEALETERREVLEKLQHPASDEDYQQLQDARRWIETRKKVAQA